MPDETEDEDGLPISLDPADDNSETYLSAVERVIKRHYGRLQAEADRRHAELLAAIVDLKKSIAAVDPVAVAALVESLHKLGGRIDGITADAQRITQEKK